MRPAFGRGKDAHFTDKGHRIRGVVHVGVNDGQEVAWYLHVGQVPVLGFEPHPDVIAQARVDFAPEIAAGTVRLESCALGNGRGRFGGTALMLNVPVRRDNREEATMGTSGLKERSLSPDYEIGRHILVPLHRFDEWASTNGVTLEPYDLLVLDVQGMELQVLEGFGDLLSAFRFLMIELSDPPIYEEEASAQEVCDFLAAKGFDRDSPILAHNDVMFVRSA